MLRLVHIVDITPANTSVDEPYPFAEYERALQEEGEKLLANRAATVREAGVESDLKLIIIKLLGERIYDAIEEQSKQWPADLIVVGLYGRRGGSASDAWQRSRRGNSDRHQTSSTHSWRLTSKEDAKKSG